ncbi:diguanylate cyclase [Photobacterium lutimaris]|uniref:diguanylate cyclase n=1 Tax=Photobacterium lutimaris TaxID=388278 RepID=A0A2T3IU84_9GAMM|nr:diguanylate cyclase [Photobacterium lutimaris]PSU31934.1 diguanylate cyclase [Photobacterium lutimaris]TDR73466.1 PAS domain S-box-containing protein/diguanylate cyclase (GGDEF)-like protein [Photobacterium lutimaris]
MHISYQERSVSLLLPTWLTLLIRSGGYRLRGLLFCLTLWGAAVFAPASYASSFPYRLQIDNSALLFSLLILVLVIGGGLLTLLLHHLDAGSYRRLHGQLTLMPTAVAVVRKKDGHLVYGNKSCRQLLGVRKLNDRYLYPDDLSEQMLCDFLRPFAGLKNFKEVNEALPQGNGKMIPLLISGLSIRCQWQSCWLLFIDSPRASHCEQVKLENEQRIFQQVLNSLSELVYFKDKSGELIGTNKAFDRFWRGRIEEGIAEEQGRRSIGNSAAHTWTTAPDGSSRLLETNFNLLLGDSGEAIGTLSISHDVTDWHEMQEVLKSEIEKREVTEQELAQRNTLLDTILSASRDPIALYNEHGVYVGCNEPFARSLGYTQQSLLGRSSADVLEPDKLELFRQTDQQVIQQGISVKTDDYVILEDGTPIWYEVLKSPYRNPTDGTTGVLMMARDVTERKMAEQQLADAIMELQELSFVDSLTKVANRRSFDEQLRKMWYSHIREKNPLTLILCDIDYFKAFNDNYGHQQGDFALREVAKVLRSVVKRETDEVARYGGEEFAFLLPNTSLAGGEVVAAAIHRALAEKGLTHSYSDIAPTLTVSLGVATLIPLPNQDYGKLVELADVALYRAKAAGRNCTMTMSEKEAS